MTDDKTSFISIVPKSAKPYPFARFPQGDGGTEVGFGLARGGFGIYAYCPVCGIITSKWEVPD